MQSQLQVMNVLSSVFCVARYGAANSILGGLAIATFTSMNPVHAQSVIADGGSATTVSQAPGGQITIGIAPANAASISHNTYSSFSVPASGVNLDNSVVSAGTILNEVTSARPTTIEGSLSVIGPKADVIVANPNGITVNGGRFRNMRNVALTTGVPGRDAGGHVTADISAGQIAIGRSGLSGTMEELALISHSLRVDGPIAYETPGGKEQSVNIIAGDNSVQFNPARGGAGVLPWAMATDRGSQTTDAVLVDISEGGSLTSGRIRVAVTDAGAGVRFAGDQVASAGGFRLTHDGHIELSGARIEAKESVNIKASSAKLISDDRKRSELISETGGVVVELENGDLDLGSARLSGATVASDNLASSGGVTLLVNGKINSHTSPKGQRAELISSQSHVVVSADGPIGFAGLFVEAAGDFRLATPDAIHFADMDGTAEEDFLVLATGALSFDASRFKAANDIRLDAAALRFGADRIDQARTELVADAGGFVGKTSAGDILNYGSLLQGNTASVRDPGSLGGMTLSSAGGILNKSLSRDRLAVAFGRTDDLWIEATDDVVNKTGRLFSNAAISITTDGDILNETDVSGRVMPFSTQSHTGSRFASSLFLKRSRHTNVFGNYGRETIRGERSYILGVGDISLEATNIDNIGADITGASVGITASGAFSNETRQVGMLYFSQSCKFFCKTRGFSTLRTISGNVTGSDRVVIDAGTSVTNVAGRIDGARGVDITAPVTRFVPLLTASFIDQHAGATGLFGGGPGLLATGLDMGILVSAGGRVTINGDADLSGANVYSRDDLMISGTRIQSRYPPEEIIFGRQPIGLLWNLF